MRPPGSHLDRWARGVVRWRVLVVAVWAVVVVIGAVSAARLPGLLSTSLAVPGTASQTAGDLLEQHFGQNPDGTFTVVVPERAAGPAGSAGAAASAAARSLKSFQRALAGAARSLPTARAEAARQDQGILFASISTSVDLQKAASYTGALRQALAREGLAGAYVTGPPALQYDINPVLESDLHRGEVIAGCVAFVLLALVLGLSPALLVPFALAAGTTTLALAVIYALAHQFLVMLYVPNLVELIGLGLAVDYSLLVVHRFREELADPGRPEVDAIVATMATAGRTVLLSATAIAIGLAAVLLVPVPFVRSLGLAGIVVPLAAMAGVLTLQPALLSLLGRRGMRAFGLPGRLGTMGLGGRGGAGAYPSGPRASWAAEISNRDRQEDARVSVDPHLRSSVQDESDESGLEQNTLANFAPERALFGRHAWTQPTGGGGVPPERGGAFASPFWSRLAGLAMGHPVAVLLCSAGALAAAAAPVAALQLTPGSVSAIPQQMSSARGLALLRSRVGPGLVTPVQVVVDSGRAGRALSPAYTAATLRFAQRALADPEAFIVEIGSRPPYVDPSGRYLDLSVVGRHDFGDEATQQLVRQLRRQFIPAARYPPGARVYVGGGPAEGVDFLQRVYGNLPLDIGLLVAAAYVVLLRAFRSLLLPLIAVLLDAVSATATYGLLVVVFRYGVGARLIGLYHVAQVEGWVPAFLFAMLFGLSMDYEVFFVRRMREAWDRGRDNRAAVAEGLASTGRVVTAAALIMVGALWGLVAGHVAGLQELGVGLSLGALLDATIVRGLLMPSLMALFGRWNWWLPVPVARLARAEPSPLARSERAGLPESLPEALA